MFDQCIMRDQIKEGKKTSKRKEETTKMKSKSRSRLSPVARKSHACAPFLSCSPPRPARANFGRHANAHNHTTPQFTTSIIFRTPGEE